MGGSDLDLVNHCHSIFVLRKEALNTVVITATRHVIQSIVKDIIKYRFAMNLFEVDDCAKSREC